jgi:hypothetical protein
MKRFHDVVLPGVVAAGTEEERRAVLPGVVLRRVDHRNDGSAVDA